MVMATNKLQKLVIPSIIQYDTLLNGEQPSTTSTSKTLFNGRKFSDYRWFVFVAERGGGIRTTSIIPYARFSTNDHWISLSEVDSANKQRWYEVHRTSDTTVTIQKSSTASSDSVSLFVYGLYLE